MSKTTTKKINPTPQIPALKKFTAIAEPGGMLNKSFIQAIIVFVLAFIIYADNIPNSYIQDDAAAITENKLVLQGVHGIPKLLKTGFVYGLTGTNEGTYRPVSLVTFAMEYSLWGENPHMSHLVNDILFAISVVLLLYLLRLLFGKKYGLLCFVAALLYAAHPIHTEAVSSIKSRDEIFCLLFAMLSMFSFVKFADNFKEKFNPTAALWVACGVITLFLSMASKESSVPFLIIIPLAIFYFRKTEPKVWIATAVFAGLAVGGYMLLRYELFGSVENIHTAIQKTDNILANKDGGRQPMATAFVILIRYILLLIFPQPLSHDYSFPQLPLYKWESAQAILSFIFCAGLLLYSIVQIRKREIAGFAIFFFFLSVSVVANIFLIIGCAMAERFMYMPSLGFCLLLALGIVKFLFRPDSTGKVAMSGWIVTIVIVGLYSFKTITRNRDWKDNITLYSIDVNHSPNSSRTHYSLGTQLFKNSAAEKDSVKRKEMLRNAEAELLKSIDLNPEYADAYINIGNVYHELGDYEKENEYLSQLQNSTDKNGSVMVLFNKGNILFTKNDYVGAIRIYRTALEIKPDEVKPLTNIGSSYSALGMPDSAIYFLNKAINLDPKLSEAYVNLGSAYSAKGLQFMPMAIEQFNKALKLNPKSAEAYINLGAAEIKLRQIPQAIEHLDKGIALRPNSPEAYRNKAYGYQLLKKYDQAIATFWKEAELKPNSADPLVNIGVCYEGMEKFKQAEEVFQKAIVVNPKSVDAYMNLGYCYTRFNKLQQAIDYYKKAVEIAPNEYRALGSIHGLYKKLGDKEKAAEYLRLDKEAKARLGVK